MRTKFSIAKTGVLRALICLIISSNSYGFDEKIFNQINDFFKKVNSDLFLDKKDIIDFNQQKINSGFITQKHQINIPYFIFNAQKLTNDYVFYIGGIHADEFTPLYFSINYLYELIHLDLSLLEKNIIYIPILDIDGFIDGILDRNYPYRHNGMGKDLNRNFYAFDELPHFKSSPENELVISLIKKYSPKFWIIPHSSINILDFDGLVDETSTKWLQDVHDATTISGGDAIPIQDFRDYAPQESKTNWSIGKLANHLGNIYSLTYEFSGPGKYPEPNAPNRDEIIIKRKQLGRFEDTAWYAEIYFNQYKKSMDTALFINE